MSYTGARARTPMGSLYRSPLGVLELDAGAEFLYGKGWYYTHTINWYTLFHKYSNGTWTTETAYPDGDIVVPMSIRFGNKLYSGMGTRGPGGGTANASVKWFEYDIISKVWTRLADFIGDSYSFSGIAAHNNKIYIIGGNSRVTAQNLERCYVYDITTNAWSAIADYPLKIRGPVCGAYNGKIYSALGNAASPPITGTCKKAYVYDIMTNTWSNLPDCPNIGISNTGTMIGENFFVGDGTGSAYFYNTGWYKYNVTANAWTTLSRRVPGGSTDDTYWLEAKTSPQADGSFICMFGYSFDGWIYYNHSDIYKYVPSTDTWTYFTFAPFATSRGLGG